MLACFFIGGGKLFADIERLLLLDKYWKNTVDRCKKGSYLKAHKCSRLLLATPITKGVYYVLIQRAIHASGKGSIVDQTG